MVSVIVMVENPTKIFLVCSKAALFLNLHPWIFTKLYMKLAVLELAALKAKIVSVRIRDSVSEVPRDEIVEISSKL